MAKGIRLSQANELDLSGGSISGQFATTDTPAKTDGHIGKWISNQIVDGVVPVSALLTSTGAGGTTQGATLGGYGSLIGQIPRGNVDGSNTHFTLDFKVLNPWTWLEIGDVVQLPPWQSDPAALPFGYKAVPGAEYMVQEGSNVLTVARAPQPGERFYIWYIRAEPLPDPSNIMLTVTTAYTQNTANGGNAEASVYGTVWSFGRLPFLSESATYAKRDDTTDVTTTLSGATNPDTFFVSFHIAFGYGGDFDIYDAYLTCTFPDGSTAIYKPTRARTSGDSSGYMVENPPVSATIYSIDGDVNTFARIHGDHWPTLDGLGGEFELILDQFAPVSSTPGPTPVAPTLAPVTSTSSDMTLPPGSTGQIVNVTGSGPTTISLPPIISAPSAPTLGSTAGGSLLATTYYAEITYVNANGETVQSAESYLAVSANNLLTVTSPSAATGVTGYDVYVGSTSGTETKQNVNAIPIGTDWTLPTTGLVSSVIAPPAINTSSPSSTFSNTIANTGSGTVTIAAPSGVAINGTTGGTFTLAPDTSALVLYNPSTGYSAISNNGSISTSATHSEMLTDASGSPIITSDGDTIYVSGIPN